MSYREYMTGKEFALFLILHAVVYVGMLSIVLHNFEKGLL